jgi:hypothetical protein
VASPLAAIRELLPSERIKVPKTVKDNIDRGKARLDELAPHRDLCWKFWRGETYWYVGSDNYLVQRNTVTNQDGTGKDPHRVRTTRNLIKAMVARKVSLAVSRTPSYQVSPSTTSQDDANAAKLSEKVALYGYDKWDLRAVREKVVKSALVADEGFAWAYWDCTVPPYVLDEQTGQLAGRGEVCIETYSANDVGWEPGVDFDRSRWHFVRSGKTPDEVYSLDGYLGGAVTPDATPGDTTSRKARQQAKLVMVYDYLERPSLKYPDGRWLTLANARVICGIEQGAGGEPGFRAYPCVDGEGHVTDEPVLHKLYWDKDPDSDHDRGLVRDLISPTETYNDCTNKQLEAKNLGLNLQSVGPAGMRFLQKRTDEPGAHFEVAGDPNLIKFLDPPNPALFELLSDLKNEAKADMQFIAADVPEAEDEELETQESVWDSFYTQFAEWDSRLMRHCLYLVQRHYTEPRLIEIKGLFGPEPLDGFLGADLRSQQSVRVLPDSIKPRTKKQIEQRVMFLVQMFPGPDLVGAGDGRDRGRDGGEADRLLRA